MAKSGKVLNRSGLRPFQVRFGFNTKSLAIRFMPYCNTLGADCISMNYYTYTMKNFLILTLFLITLGLAGCEKTKTIHPLDGTWLEITEKSDTIDFMDFATTPALEVSRGLVLHNGYWLPKYGSGFYSYKLLDSDSIGLCWWLSSSCISTVPISYSAYFFKLSTNETIEISNFYNPDISPDEILTFLKIE